MPACKTCTLIQEAQEIIRQRGVCRGCGNHLCPHCGCTERNPCFRVGTDATCTWKGDEFPTLCTFCASAHAASLYAKATGREYINGEIV